jgi:translation initiation factor IF-3
MVDSFYPLIFFGGKISIKDLQTNKQIKDRELRVISDTGEQLGVMSGYDAHMLAEQKDLDLVKISPNVIPPVCKIMDYGKFCFEQSKKDKEAKKRQKTTEMKEIWLSMTIEAHDLAVKARQAVRFAKDGDKIKVSIRMKGRQNAHSSFGVAVMERFYEVLKDYTVIEKKPLTEGRNIIMILSPSKTINVPAQPQAAATASGLAGGAHTGAPVTGMVAAPTRAVSPSPQAGKTPQPAHPTEQTTRTARPPESPPAAEKTK